MKCLQSLDRLFYPASLVSKLVELYRFQGKDFYYEDVLKNELDSRIEKTVEKDTINAVKLLDLNVSDNRIKLIVKNDSEPRTKSELVVKNLKNVFKIIQKEGTDLKLDSNEFLMLAVKIFQGFKDVRYATTIVKVRNNLLEESQRVSKRDTIEEAIKIYKDAVINRKIEPTQVITNFYVDLLMEECFDSYNEFLSLLILYALLVSQRFNVFKYISFFEMYNEMKPMFDSSVSGAKYSWNNNYPETAMLNLNIIDLMVKGYNEVEGFAQTHAFEKNIRKIDNVQGAIAHFPSDTFTREDIKKAVPYLSDSTINRALKDLKEQGKIEALGTGRSAKWIRKTTTEVINSRTEQMSIFSLIDEE